MLFRALTMKKAQPLNVMPAHAYLPMRIGHCDVATSIAKPLAAKLAVVGLGGVTEATVRRDSHGDACGIDLFLALTIPTLETLKTVALILEDMNAPVGSSIRLVDGGTPHIFGRTEGLGLYIGGLGETDAGTIQTDVLEVCKSALADTGSFQGWSQMKDRTVLYFYGENFSAMRRALTRVLETRPQLRDTYARRLT